MRQLYDVRSLRGAFKNALRNLDLKRAIHEPSRRPRVERPEQGDWNRLAPRDLVLSEVAADRFPGGWLPEMCDRKICSGQPVFFGFT